MPEINSCVKELRRLTAELESAVNHNYYGARTLNQLVAAEAQMARASVLIREAAEAERVRYAAA